MINSFYHLPKVSFLDIYSKNGCLHLCEHRNGHHDPRSVPSARILSSLLSGQSEHRNTAVSLRVCERERERERARGRERERDNVRFRRQNVIHGEGRQVAAIAREGEDRSVERSTLIRCRRRVSANPRIRLLIANRTHRVVALKVPVNRRIHSQIPHMTQSY